MKINRLKLFRNVFANFILSAVVIGLLFFAFGSGSLTAVSTAENGAYYAGNREGQKVGLMFNVYSGGEFLDGICKELEKANAKATFFIGGVWAEKNRDIIILIKEKGHEIGNHGYLHKDSDKLSAERLTQEIKSTENLIFALTEVRTSLFAPPSGAVNSAVVKTASSLGYKTVMWSKDTIDWRDQDHALITKRATNALTGGDLILMHPTKATLAALPSILAEVSLKGLRAVTVSNCLSADVI